MKVEAYRPLSRKERRALMVAVTVAGIYVALILWLTFSSYGILPVSYTHLLQDISS